MARRRRLIRWPRGTTPLVPLAPAIVIVVGIATAVAIALIGIGQLAKMSDQAASLRAEVLAATLSARLRGTIEGERAAFLREAARRAGSEILLVDQGGHVLINESFSAPARAGIVQMLTLGKGETTTSLGRVRFAARPLHPPLSHLSVLTFVSAPSPPPDSIALGNAVAALTVLLLGVAVAVALSFTKSARDDVDYLRERITVMARGQGQSALPTDVIQAEPVPIRSLDQVGLLTAAFNLLITRFAAAERTYRADLQQASAMDRERSAFLAGLSHELRTPLNAILGFAHVLESEVDGPLSQDAREALSVIRQSGEHLRTLIDDILDLSALETGKLQLSRRAVNLRALVDQVMREASAAARDKPLQLRVTGDHALVAHADPRRVRQILTNLVSNAVKFTARGSVTVNITGRGRYAAIVVQDTGPGIPPEETSAVFEEYRQTGDVRSRRAGTGLGLSIARRLVLMHGGTIQLESELGRGSTFTITLPMWIVQQPLFAPTPPTPDVAAPPGNDPGAGGPQGRIA
ncbi:MULTISPECIES: sensor histidine kinase [Sorangium]|uniref:histidine kinase n=1 Tax=Sorangium cellulosum (strain So ce56) TaxID=448385 RepID=A9ESF8_SORC5|nr:HAMP domain-containing sensor histidine kinase [Sorangium cellulosum]CAN97383.1 two component sensor kinase [Sorangium cellulosum So ce56]